MSETSEIHKDSSSPTTSEKHVKTKVPEIEINIYKKGKGPIAVLKTALGGWEQDQIEVREILEKYGFKSLYAFNPVSNTRGVSIRFHPRNGRSLLTYRDGSVIHVDGEPKDSMIQPVTKILIGVVVITFLITLVVKDPPEWVKKFDISGGSVPPWVLACAVIVFTRMRKRTKDLMKKFGW